MISGYFYFIDEDSNLYRYPGEWLDKDGIPLEPILCATGIEDICWGEPGMLALKTDGTLGTIDYKANLRTFTAIADGVWTVTGSGYITRDGDFWTLRRNQEAEFISELQPDAACAIYFEDENEFLRVLKNGKIEAAYAGYVH